MICWRSQSLRQNINWSARHWQITIFCDNQINDKLLFLSFDHEFVFLMNIFGQMKWFATFMQEQSHLRIISTILFAAKHSWVTLSMSRPLFVGSYLLVTWWPFGQWKGKKLHQMIINNIIIPRVHWIWVGYNYVISNKCEWNCFIKNAHKISRILPEFICKNNRFSYPRWLSQSEL